MLQPLLEKPNALYFGIKRRELTFAVRISFFLADMLKADEVTATYKYARCKMPCHTCMVSLNDLNNMDLSPENMPFRIHGNIQDRKSTRLNSSHRCISYAVFCLKKKIHEILLKIH